MRWIECKSQNLERRAMQCFSLWLGSDKSMTTMNTQRLWLHAKKEKHGTRKGNKEKGQQQWVRRGSAGVVMEKRVNWKRIWSQPFLFTHRAVKNREIFSHCVLFPDSDEHFLCFMHMNSLIFYLYMSPREKILPLITTKYTCICVVSVFCINVTWFHPVVSFNINVYK